MLVIASGDWLQAITDVEISFLGSADREPVSNKEALHKLPRLFFFFSS